MMLDINKWIDYADPNRGRDHSDGCVCGGTFEYDGRASYVDVSGNTINYMHTYCNRCGRCEVESNKGVIL